MRSIVAKQVLRALQELSQCWGAELMSRAVWGCRDQVLGVAPGHATLQGSIVHHSLHVHIKT